MLFWADEPGERSQGSVVIAAITCHLDHTGARQTHVTDEENKVQRERFAPIHAAAGALGLRFQNQGSFLQQQPLLPGASHLCLSTHSAHTVKQEEARTKTKLEGLGYGFSMSGQRRGAAVHVPPLSTLRGGLFTSSVYR